MPTNHKTPEEVIAAALALPAEQRMVVLDAIHASLADPSIDQMRQEPPAEVQSAWKAEIARRLEDIKSGRVHTITAEDAEKMIRAGDK